MLGVLCKGALLRWPLASTPLLLTLPPPAPSTLPTTTDNGFTTPGTWKVWGKSMYAPFGRVHWAGTEYAFKWLGYYDGELLPAVPIC